jgi:membrane-associated phospholipid phosphatase
LLSRRGFLRGMGGLGGGAALTGLALPPGRRTLGARAAAARLEEELPDPTHASNGDETALPGFIACYSKGLPHSALGEVDAAAYRLLRQAIESGDPADFEAVPLGGFLKLANPQAALAENLIGPDPARLDLQPPPRFASAEQGAELVELSWQALLRDVPFADYAQHPLARRATAELGSLADFRGPRAGSGRGGEVTSDTLFRGTGAGSLAGPYISQFLYRDLFLPPIWVKQQVRTAAAGIDYMTAHDTWLACQNGALTGVNRFDDRPRHIRNGRDLGEWVHRDFSYQAALDACLMLLKLGVPASGANPYMHSRTQTGFATFGPPYLYYLLAVVTQVALTVTWYQKWCVHRRLRPEEYAGRVEIHRTGRARYPLPDAVPSSAALDELTRRHATALLPQAYPEGCPSHPSYPAAHAVIAAAGVTVLKAFFDGSFLLPGAVVATADGLALEPYAGPPLTVGGELDKLAWNVGMGRNFAGIHWRSDLAAGMELGERVTIAVLREMKLTGNEIFSGFSLRRFDGSRVTV